MNVPNGVSDLFAQFFLVDFHFHDFKREPFVEETIDSSTAAKFHNGHVLAATAFDTFLEVATELLYHSEIERAVSDRQHPSVQKCLLQHGFRFPRRIVNAEVLVFGHFFLEL